MICTSVLNGDAADSSAVDYSFKPSGIDVITVGVLASLTLGGI